MRISASEILSDEMKEHHRRQVVIRLLLDMNYSTALKAADHEDLLIADVIPVWKKLNEVIQKAILRRRTLTPEEAAELFLVDNTVYTPLTISLMCFSERKFYDALIMRKGYVEIDTTPLPLSWVKELAYQ